MAIFDWCSPVDAASTVYAFLCVCLSLSLSLSERKEMHAAILSRKESPAVCSAVNTERKDLYLQVCS